MPTETYIMPAGRKGDTYISPEFRKVNQILPELVDGVLETGEEYLIKEYEAGDDFTDIGADDNKTGVIFEATDTTPNIWISGSVLVKIQNITLAGARIRCELYKNNTLVKTFDTEDGSIEIVDEAKGIYKFANFVPDFDGNHVFDIEVTYASSIISTHFEGTWYFKNDRTKPLE